VNTPERLYNLVIHTILPLAVIGSYTSFLGREPDRNTRERFIPEFSSNVHDTIRLWIHGASVGEIQMARFLRDWAEAWGLPSKDILITSQTLSGLASINHPTKMILPADYPQLLTPLDESIKGVPLIVLETEIWPNLFRQRSGNLFVFNGHMKDETYSWYRRLRPLIGSAVSHCNTVMARTEVEADRYRSLSRTTDPEIRASGDIKWINLLDSSTNRLQGSSFKGSGPTWIAGSTWEGEESIVIELTESLPVQAYIAPRHLDRISEIQDQLNESPLRWEFWSGNHETDADVILVDEIGILSDLYKRGDLAFVGGSWVDGVGGHNVLEPARFGIPVLVGPHTSNIQHTVNRLQDIGLLRTVHSKNEMEDTIRTIISDPDDNAYERASARLQEEARTVRDRYRDELYRILENRS